MGRGGAVGASVAVGNALGNKPENGLLTANGKFKRDLIAQRFQSQIEEMYAVRQAL